MGRLFTKSEGELAETKLQKIETHKQSARFFREIAKVLLDAEVTDEMVREEVFKRVSREQVNTLVTEANELDKGEATTLFELLDDRFKYMPNGRPEQQGCGTNSRPVTDPLKIGHALLHLWRMVQTN